VDWRERGERKRGGCKAWSAKYSFWLGRKEGRQRNAALG